MMSNRLTTITVLGLSLCMSRGVMADEAMVQGDTTAPSSFWTARVYAIGNSDLKEGDASYATSHVALEFGYRPWRLGLERQYFSWRKAESFVEDTEGRDPWEFFNKVQIGFSRQNMHSERWVSEILVGAALGFEDEISDSFTGYLGGYGIYELNPRLFLLSRHVWVMMSMYPQGWDTACTAR